MSPPAEPPADNPSASKLHHAKVNLKYLAMGSAAGVAPASLTTRSMLTTTRYVVRYVIKRALRYAKYAAVGAVIAAVGGGLLGTLGSGLAFFAAPGIGVGMGVGVLTAVAKFGWRHRGNHFRGGAWEGMKARAQAGRDGAEDEKIDAGKTKQKEADNKARRADVWMRV
ncbi:hypothetical protein CI109_103677 [Kwoniella shandongensis]|uniref:Uncharacterized protein n=1 Tax=Kwoniella shandongensis TaxID=1734106 RepID=A0A5M6C7E8_9TREE|nr:uncharacterized protein CI109_000629 [Kwoniella shandongensis]KAA5531057.1 hypothetical protein CI109_000629 [Kwoniella shandongensis]